MDGRLGISGRIAERFLTQQLTPLLALAGLPLGLFAVLVTPREVSPMLQWLDPRRLHDELSHYH